MKNQSNPFAEKLLRQESVDSALKGNYEKRIAEMMDCKIPRLFRVVCALVALCGIVFTVFLGREYCQPLQHDVKFIIKSSILLLLVCVIFYTTWAAMAAIRGKSLFGSAPSVILGAVIASGFFACLWSFLIFVLPKLMQLFHEKSEYPFVSDVWIVGTVCMFLIIGFFGVLTAGTTFILHLLCKYHGQNRMKLLAIELAIAELAENKTESSSSN